MPRLHSVGEASKLLGVTIKTIRKKISDKIQTMLNSGDVDENN